VLAWLIASVAAPGVVSAEPMNSCAYMYTFVDAGLPDPFATGAKAMESAREALIDDVRRILPHFGVHRVDDPEEAYWVLTVGAMKSSDDNALMSIELSPELRLQHHIFVAQLEDDDFPYRGTLGIAVHIEWKNAWSQRVPLLEVQSAIKALYKPDAEQIAALCAMEDRLRDQGWSGIKELREELVKEMKRVRRERAAQSKNLRLEVDE